MRLTEYELKSIINTFKEVFRDGKIYLFGSRVDDTKKGGDIDLYLEVCDHDNIVEKKIQFLSLLEQSIGEQKIDVVFNKDDSRLIEREAKTKRIELKMDTLKLKKYFHECDKHIQRIEEAFTDLKKFMPVSTVEYINLNKDQVQAIDQYLFRFSKLQDTIGDKIFKLILSFYEETNATLPFLDVINKLEKLGYIFSAKEWINLRKIRNNISHQYDDEPEEMSQSINTIVAHKDVMIHLYKNLKNKYEESLEKSDVLKK